MCADNGYAMSSFDSFPVAQNASSSSDKLPASGITEVRLNVSVCFFLRAYTSSDTACVLIMVTVMMGVYFSFAQTASLSNDKSVEDSATVKVGVLYFCCS